MGARNRFVRRIQPSKSACHLIKQNHKTTPKDRRRKTDRTRINVWRVIRICTTALLQLSTVSEGREKQSAYQYLIQCNGIACAYLAGQIVRRRPSIVATNLLATIQLSPENIFPYHRDTLSPLAAASSICSRPLSAPPRIAGFRRRRWWDLLFPGGIEETLLWHVVFLRRATAKRVSRK